MKFPDVGMLWTMWIGSAVIWLGLSVLVYRRWKLPQKPAPWVILGVAAAVRLSCALFVPVSLSDDVWRYLYDGQTLAAGNNPYAAAPAQEIHRREADGTIDDFAWMKMINNAELVTIYQPTSQWFFAGVTKVYNVVTPGEGDVWGALRAYRVAFALLDLLIVLLLMRQLKQLGRSAWWAVMYAWSPLVISETSWNAHQDGIGVAAMLGALLLAQAGTRADEGWRSTARLMGAGAMLALALGVKPIVLPLALLMAWKVKTEFGGVSGRGWWRGVLGVKGWGRVFAAAGACVGTLLALYLPFVFMEGGLTGMFETSKTFVEHWRFNSTIHLLIETTAAGVLGAEGSWENAVLAKQIADGVSALLLVVVLVAAMAFHRVPWRAATTYLFASLCLSSTVHPWYLLWVMALLPVAWSSGRTFVGPAVWVASLTVPWSYWAWINYIDGGPGGAGAFDGRYTIGVGLVWVIWLPVYAALIWGTWVTLRQVAAERRGDTSRVPGGRG